MVPPSSSTPTLKSTQAAMCVTEILEVIRSVQPFFSARMLQYNLIQCKPPRLADLLHNLYLPVQTDDSYRTYYLLFLIFQLFTRIYPFSSLWSHCSLILQPDSLTKHKKRSCIKTFNHSSRNSMVSIDLTLNHKLCWEHFLYEWKNKQSSKDNEWIQVYQCTHSRCWNYWEVQVRPRNNP